MIRFRLREIIAEFEFREKRRLTLDEISRATGIHQTTLSKISRTHGYNTTTENINKLCAFFQVPVQALMEYVADSPEAD